MIGKSVMFGWELIGQFCNNFNSAVHRRINLIVKKIKISELTNSNNTRMIFHYIKFLTCLTRLSYYYELIGLGLFFYCTLRFIYKLATVEQSNNND